MRMRMALMALFALAAGTHAQLATEVFLESKSGFPMQRPFDLPISARFSDTGGIYTCWVMPGDKPHALNNTTAPRTEMRWETWTDQGIDHMWEADVMYESRCNRTCIRLRSLPDPFLDRFTPSFPRIR